jgi:hypothetical protein
MFRREITTIIVLKIKRMTFFAFFTSFLFQVFVVVLFLEPLRPWFYNTGMNIEHAMRKCLCHLKGVFLKVTSNHYRFNKMIPRWLSVYQESVRAWIRSHIS